MSATNHTTNYELPIFVGTDKPAWLVDWNGAMTAIDTAIHTAEGKADQAGTDIGGIESSISTINSTLTSINNAVSQLRIDTNANTGNINTINSLIGNGEPTTTDKTIIGAINEINGKVKAETIMASVTSDGVKTWGTLFNELYALVSSRTLTEMADTVLIIDGSVHTLTHRTDNRIGYINFYISDTGSKLHFEDVTLRSSASLYRYSEIQESGTYFSSHQDDVPESGKVISIEIL